MKPFSLSSWAALTSALFIPSAPALSDELLHVPQAQGQIISVLAADGAEQRYVSLSGAPVALRAPPTLSVRIEVASTLKSAPAHTAPGYPTAVALDLIDPTALWVQEHGGTSRIIRLEGPRTVESTVAYGLELRRSGVYRTVEFSHFVRSASVDNQFNLSQINLGKAIDDAQGGGVLIGVVDGPVRTGHPALAGVLSPDSYDFVNDEVSVEQSADSDFHATSVISHAVSAQAVWPDLQGTSVSSTVTPAQACAQRVCATADIIDALLWLTGDPATTATVPVTARPAVILLPMDFPTQSAALQSAFENAIASGAILVLASGNGNVSDDLAMLNVPGVLVIGSVTQTDEKATYSDYGPSLDAVAYGGEIATDKGIPCAIYFPRVGDTYTPCEGTSYAAAQAAGVIALMLSVDPSLNGASFEVIFANGGMTRDLGDAQRFGTGVLDAQKGVLTAYTNAGKTPPADTDGDGYNDGHDQFPLVPGHTDTDGDGTPDETDTDDDNDGVPDTEDDFPLDARYSRDTDGDGTPDDTDTDDDGDGVPDTEDDFPLDARYSRDTDGDTIPNEVDDDDDGDGVPDSADSHPLDSRYSQDTDQDDVPDELDADDDGDGVPDSEDAFPQDARYSRDSDGDSTPDEVDFDDDGDGVPDSEDAYPLDPRYSRDTDGDSIPNEVDADDDGDGVPDTEDDFPLDPRYSRDTDGDSIPNEIDEDDDNDGVLDSEDAFPLDERYSRDLDGDRVADEVDDDRDGDSYANDDDLFPDNAQEWADFDEDGLGDNSDPDTDNDGAPNEFDDFPFDPEATRDTDQDGIDDLNDPDIDGDGVDNDDDVFPFDATEHADLDGDLIGDNQDNDADGDGSPRDSDSDDLDCNVPFFGQCPPPKSDSLDPDDPSAGALTWPLLLLLGLSLIRRAFRGSNV